MKRKILWGITLLIILSIFIVYLNCTKNSIRYEPKKGPYLYTNGGFYDDPIKLIYVISTETDSVVDSISLGPYNWPSDLALSPDKRTLYVLVGVFDTITFSFTSFTYYEIDTRTKVTKYVGPNSSIVISPDGKYLFQNEGEFRIFDAYTHQLVYAESTIFLPGCFARTAPLAYGEVGGEMKVFNYETKRFVGSFSICLRDGRIPGLLDYELSPDGMTLYYLGRTTWEFYFCAFDLSQDSLLAQVQLNSGGQFGVKPDGSTIYITDPGGGGPCITTDPPPSGSLGVFDVRTNTSSASISLDPLSDPPYAPPPLGPFFIKITPDGKKAYLTICRNRVLVIDIVRNEPLRTILLPNEHATVDIMAL